MTKAKIVYSTKIQFEMHRTEFDDLHWALITTLNVLDNIQPEMQALKERRERFNMMKELLDDVSSTVNFDIGKDAESNTFETEEDPGQFEMEFDKRRK